MNKVIMTGRLCADPETGTTQSGINYANIRIAVDRISKGNQTADFFNCTAWRQTAEFIGKYFTKGRKIVLEGSLQNSEYTAQDGSKKQKTVIIIDRAEFADGKNESAQSAAQPEFTVVEKDPDLPF